MPKSISNSVFPLFLLVSLPLFIIPEVTYEAVHKPDKRSAPDSQSIIMLAQASKPDMGQAPATKVSAEAVKIAPAGTVKKTPAGVPTQLSQAPKALSQQQEKISAPEERSKEKTSAGVDAWRKLKLVATAYNSVAAQTDSTPDIAAWGDKLKPGMKSIAVSRDLLKMGLKRGSKVRISGLEGEYVVLDKMNKRWKKRIDIYMGVDVKAARKFGKREVVMHYKPDTPLLLAENN